MTLLSLVLVTLVLFALFWGGGSVAQRYLYNEPAERMPLRALAAALAVGSFLSLWCLIDKKNPGKYDTFFEFASYTSAEFHEFEAVRWTRDPSTPSNKPGFRKNDKGEPAETVAKFSRPGGNKSAPFRENGSGETFRLTTSSAMTAAIVVAGADGNPVRLRAEMVVAGPGGKPAALTPEVQKNDPRGVSYAATMRFVEEKGSRYVMAKTLDEHKGVLFVPSSGVVALALLLNIGHFVVWFVAAWLLLRFGWGHSLGFAVAAGLLTMLVILPLLFKPNREPKVPAAKVEPLAALRLGAKPQAAQS